MQTELRLFQIPKVDTSSLSGIGEFHDRIEKFERFWNMKLEFSPNARWLPGSYERLKGQVVKSLFPNWEKPRGANTIRKLTRYDNYTLGNLQKSLIEIDDDLRRFRNNKIHLEGGKAAIEGKELLMELMDNYSKALPDVHVDITSIPYWFKDAYHSGDTTNIHPIVPCIDFDGTLPNPLVGYHARSRSPKLVKERMAQTSASKDPKRWFINIIVSLRDITIRYWKRTNEKEVLADIPWGDLYVGFTIPIYDVVMNFRKLKHGVNLSKTPLDTCRFSNHTYKFPFIPGIQHPFVHRGFNDQTNSYEWGNTCFGSWKTEVTTALCTGNLAHLKAILVCWSETYHCNNTSPLNQPETCHLGQDVNWEKGISQYLRTSPTACRTAVQAGYTTTDLLEGHCSICALKDVSECTYFEELTYIPYEMPKEFLDALTDKLGDLNGEWVSKYTIILRLTQKMWSMKTRVTDALFNSWFYIQDCGTGFMEYQCFIDELERFHNWKASHYGQIPKRPEDWPAVASIMIELYTYAERVYWTHNIRNFNMNAWERLADSNRFEWIADAEIELPLDELKSMIHTYCLQSGLADSKPSEYSAYLIDIYQLNQAMENNRQSFEEAIEELQAAHLEDLSDVEVVEDTEGPF